MKKDKDILNRYKKINPWGMSMCLDLYDCDPQIIRNAEKIKEFTKSLCELIKMKRFGETVVVDFGDEPRVSGFSMTQLIETSLISGHFANQSNAAYLDIFSCKAYSPQKTAQFAKIFLKQKK